MRQPISPTFARDSFTWMTYILLAHYAYLQAGMGPLMPFLREELALTYTVAGLHFSSFAGGMIVAGLITDGLASVLGRRAVFWLGTTGLGIGALVLILGRVVGLTTTGAFLMGLSGSLLLIIIQASLSDKHGSRRAIAFAESNVLASVGAGMAPLVIGGFQAAGLGWRAGVLASVSVGLLFSVFYRNQAFPEDVSSGRTRQGRGANRLPGAYWAYWLVLFLTVSAEWTLVFWGADFLENAAGLSRSLAASLLSVFFLAMLSGRLLGSFLTRRMAAPTLLLGALVTALLGFFLFWLPRLAVLNVIGLFVAGLGVANLYPLTLAAATAEAAELANKASARVSLGAGLAIFSAPLALGYVADRIGIQGAFGTTAVLLVLALLFTWLAMSYISAAKLRRT